jgi:hypothetical protein
VNWENDDGNVLESLWEVSAVSFDKALDKVPDGDYDEKLEALVESLSVVRTESIDKVRDKARDKVSEPLAEVRHSIHRQGSRQGFGALGGSLIENSQGRTITKFGNIE